MANAHHQFGIHASLGAITAANAEIRAQIENVGTTLANLEGALPDGEIAISCMTRIVELAAAGVLLAERRLELSVANAERNERAMTALVLGERMLEVLVVGAEQRDRAMPLLERGVLALEALAGQLEHLRSPAEPAGRHDAGASPASPRETHVSAPQRHAGQRGGTGKKNK